LIVDDSALARNILTEGLSADPEIEVLGTAPDVYVARDKIVLKKPDVVTLDIEMPRMDGIQFLKRLMPQYPLPVVVVSAMAEEGAAATLEALEHGAVDFVLKPSSSMGSRLHEMMDELRAKVKAAAYTDVAAWRKQSGVGSIKPDEAVLHGTTDKVIAFGASTGGTTALADIIGSYPSNMPGTVVVQHMPPVFTRLFAERLNATSGVEVKEAATGDRIHSGRVLIAPGGKHTAVRRSGGNYVVRCYDGAPVNGHCPSVDVAFESVARSAGPNAIGIILTGMGRDGAAGLLAMRREGARTLAQNKKTSVVFGMPAEALSNGAAEKAVGLSEVAMEITRLLGEFS
jgi:two-component system chemotaxis response regulator CheB